MILWMLVSGLDDLFISLMYLVPASKRFEWPTARELKQAHQRRIAVVVPCWREHRVIGEMLDRNFSDVPYANYDVFVGVYPNDQETLDVVSEVASRNPRIHVALCPHNGPTSKGDCLNWVYRRLEMIEIRDGVRFEVVVTHDAEDVMHPEELPMINWFSAAYDMVQIPVLPMPTGLHQFTHGLYCDEFAEYQSKDIPVRQQLGGFLPSNGVGTGFGRVALERLAATRAGQIFDPACLTEDYENGFRLHALGCTQIFLPLHRRGKGLLATREYFPKRWKPAVRQRTRWVTGIVLQGWQHHGWRVPWRQVYWFWRDRKGLVGNLFAPVANAGFAYGAVEYLVRGQVVDALQGAPPWMLRSLAVTMGISAVQAAIRMHCCAQVYGWAFAVGGPVRMFWGNLVNSAATVQAMGQFVSAKMKRRTLAWLKTDHDYPGVPAFDGKRMRVGELLVRMRCMSRADLEQALTSLPAGMRIGEHLVQIGSVSEESLYYALSSQAGIPLGRPPVDEVHRAATRALPADQARRWKVMPYRISVGELHVVTSDVPSETMTRELAGLSKLEIRFRLVRPSEFEAMAEEYLPSGRR